ncbi:hypothetical protein PHYSODRAFT_482069, partial [Phytophthora sojae]
KMDSDQRSASVVVLTVNDVYDMYPDKHGRGGAAEFATLLERERAAVPPTSTLLVTLNGDFLSGSQIGARCKGAHMVELMNHLGVDYVVLGNHEFDFGMSTLHDRMTESKFKWLGSNVLDRATSKPIDGVVDSELIELSDGLKLGIFGVCTQDTPQISNPGDGVPFEGIYKSSKRCVDNLRSDGADFIIALTRLTIEEDRQLARHVKSINVVLGGHDHEPFTLFEGNTLIHKSGQNAFWLGKLEFRLSKSKSRPQDPVSISSQWNMIANQDVPPQSECQEIMSKCMKLIEDESAEENNRVLALLGLPLSTKSSTLRTGECNMGNLTADALRSELDADVGVINGGFIRGNKIYDARTSITLGIIKEEMPLKIVLVSIRAEHLREVLTQHLAKHPAPSGSFPHVSGLRLTVDVQTQPPGIVRMEDEWGQDVELHNWLLVATTQLIFNGGDGCTAWRKGEIVRTADEITTHAADFLMKKRLVAFPEVEGRIRSNSDKRAVVTENH